MSSFPSRLGLRRRDGRDWIPVPLVAAALVAGLLKMLPFLVLLLVPHPDRAAVPIGYNLKDFTQYVALVRQAANGAGPFLSNPATTSRGDGRLSMPLFWALGLIARAGRLDPFWVLELSRLPLLVVFAACFWRLTGAAGLAPAERRMAGYLVCLSSGLGSLVLLGRDSLGLARPLLEQNLSPLLGWSGFDLAYNPLWLAGSSLLFLSLARGLQGPSTGRGAALDLVLLVACFVVHPYSGLVALAGAGIFSLADLISRRWRSLGLRAASVGGAGAVISSLVLWQRGDPGFRIASTGFFGPQSVSVFWYPVALGAVGWLAARELSRNGFAGMPGGRRLGAFIGVVILLHTSPLVNGYHFLFPLYPALCLVAAPAAAAASSRGARLVWATVLLAGTAASTARTTMDAATYHTVSLEEAAFLERLGRLPAGNVLAPAALGNLIPAYGPHHVFVGHWFLSGDARAKDALYWEATGDPRAGERLRDLLRKEHIDYVVLTARSSPAALQVLREVAAGRVFAGKELSLWSLKRE